MKGRRVACAALLGALFSAVAAGPALAAEEKTVLTFSVKEARAFLSQIHYPQSTFISEKYAPCDVKKDKYGCDRTLYNQEPDSCPTDVALGRTEEAPETPTPEEAKDGFKDAGRVGPSSDWPVANPVTVVHGVASGHIASTPEAGGFGSMYYVDNSGRRETEAHVESDAFVGNRNDYEERCAVVDSLFETSMYDGPFNAHVLTRATQGPSVYSMAAFSTLESADERLQPLVPHPPGTSKESVAIVKLWEADGKVNGLLTATVRGASLAGGEITVDAVRSVISFKSDGTEKGLVAFAKTTATGVTIAGQKLPGLSAGQVVPLGQGSFLGVIRPVVQVADEGKRLTIRAPGLFLAARTPLDRLPIPEDPLQDYEAIPGEESLMEALKEFRTGVCARTQPAGIPCISTLGGKLKANQVVYVSGAIVDTGFGRVSAFDFLSDVPTIPTFPTPPIPGLPPSITPPSLGPGPLAPPQQPVALPRIEVRELAGSPWPLLSILLFAAFGFLGIMGRWSMRFAWARSVSRYPPFPAFGWAYRAFLKG